MDFPDPTYTTSLFEPFVLGTVITPGKLYIFVIKINYCQICIDESIEFQQPSIWEVCYRCAWINEVFKNPQLILITLE